MDLRLYGRVLWRYRLLIVVGWVAACLIAFLSFYSVGLDGVSPRQAETHSASEDLYITAPGFVEGRSTIPLVGQVTADGRPATVLADGSRLSDLTTLYSQLVDSDRVREIARRDGPLDGEVVGDQYVVNNGRTALPVLRITAFADTGPGAIALAARQAAAFQEYMREEQIAAKIKPANRVVLDILRGAEGSTVVEGRSIVVPMVLFIAIMAFTVALAFVLENLRRSKNRPAATAAWDDINPDDIIAGDPHRPVRMPGESREP